MRRYPRIPHLAPGRGETRDDLVLDDVDVEALLGGPVVVEEKLDGANVSVWLDDGRIRVATRGGADAQDRGGQLGRLRAWLAPRGDELRRLLADGSTLYAEWLLLTHSIAYDELPDYFVALDLVGPDDDFIGVDDRDGRLLAAGICAPPLLFRGMLRDVDAVDALIGRSRFSTGPAEGVIVRADRPGPLRIAKRIAPGFVRLGDDGWARGRPHNRIASPSG